MYNFKNLNICVIGLGYVGLPLALELGKKYCVYGYDLDNTRVKELNNKIDSNGEVKNFIFKKSKKIKFISDIKIARQCKVFIVAVPTPVYKNNLPDLRNLTDATKTICKVIKKGDLIIYESTVYPGLTEDFCGNLIYKNNKFILNQDYFLGYSPERINPGDSRNTLVRINKLVSGSNDYALNFSKKIYQSILKAKVFTVPNIRTAELAKVLENTQRDVNIALMNELSIICNKLDINSFDVLRAAETKWNFLKFKPGLVGGHCVGVDPYYLLYKLKKINLRSNLIKNSRYINDNFYLYIYKNIIKLLSVKKIKKKLNILIIGFTFKENCHDTRNSQIIKLIKKFKNNKVDIYDPFVKKYLFMSNKVQFIKKINKKYNVIIYAVDHKIFYNINDNYIKKILKKNSILIDLKNKFSKKIVDFSI
jgi:UDP-N-acetyl-D-galactosamine dehydrogenase